MLNYEDLYTYFKQRFAFVGEGKCRWVFLSRNKTEVIKVPKSDMGDLANSRELARTDRWLGGPERYALTREHHKYSEMFRVCIIMMERVQFPPKGELPGWTMAVDCQQVGYTHDNRLVAYDWGG